MNSWACEDGTAIHMEAYAMRTSFGGESVSSYLFQGHHPTEMGVGDTGKAAKSRRIHLGHFDPLHRRRHPGDRRASSGRLADHRRVYRADDVCLMLFPVNGTLPHQGYNWRREGPRTAVGGSCGCFLFVGRRGGSPRTDILSVPGKESLPQKPGRNGRRGKPGHSLASCDSPEHRGPADSR